MVRIGTSDKVITTKYNGEASSNKEDIAKCRKYMTCAKEVLIERKVTCDEMVAEYTFDDPKKCGKSKKEQFLETEHQFSKVRQQFEKESKRSFFCDNYSDRQTSQQITPMANVCRSQSRNNPLTVETNSRVRARISNSDGQGPAHGRPMNSAVQYNGMSL